MYKKVLTDITAVQARRLFQILGKPQIRLPQQNVPNAVTSPGKISANTVSRSPILLTIRYCGMMKICPGTIIWNRTRKT